ncbi:MAG: PEP-CTERM sorting domain-containing protein [Rubrivivax sp.]|nr:PEP-CTERM sorting domain-containing protein [Rubrivivax sp.]
MFCNTGVGAREVGVAGGDSGGPSFIGGQIATVNSYGLSFGTSFGDSLSGLQSSYGEFSGYVPTYIHADFINAALVPEPGTYAMMLAGLAAMGLMVRRRQG